MPSFISDIGDWFSHHWPFGSSPAASDSPHEAPPSPVTVPADPALRPNAKDAAPVNDHYAEQSDNTVRVRKPADGPESVVYLGMNDASREAEKHAFDGNPNATVVTGAGKDAKMQGKTMSTDGKTVLDLSKEDDVRRFLMETGVGKTKVGEDGNPLESKADADKRLAALEDVFLGAKGKDGKRSGGIDKGARDEIAGFVQVLQQVEQGDKRMDQLILSGHSTGSWVYSEGYDRPGVTFEALTGLMSQFPQAQGGVKDLMLSACHTLEKSEWGDTRDGAQYTKMLPNLEDVWGYNGRAPAPGLDPRSSVNAIKNFVTAAPGNDPAKIAEAAKRSGANATSLAY